MQHKTYYKPLNVNDMEILTTKLQGATVNVIFTGSHYYFYNSFFGIFGVATRVSRPGDLGNKKFKLLVGNEHTSGSSFCSSAIEILMKRVINKAENQYVKCHIEYTTELFDGYISIDVSHVEHWR